MCVLVSDVVVVVVVVVLVVLTAIHYTGLGRNDKTPVPLLLSPGDPVAATSFRFPFPSQFLAAPSYSIPASPFHIIFYLTPLSIASL
ncbi:hypothetical protein Pmani_029287 [Petrolisthes manimaculis]|uniref:Uncharacterized protein n=1 Tax=Petrolisthes manimaculis TaxID=1843537 RepID=A0AAE1NZV5_9EUCA|nr:hypothetical protein Pmani_029287 [Petrolisthes manimaculis]